VEKSELLGERQDDLSKIRAVLEYLGTGFVDVPYKRPVQKIGNRGHSKESSPLKANP